MRVLLTCYPADVHVYPLAPVAAALQSAGHEVRVATHEHPAFAGALERVGLTAVSLGSRTEPEPVHLPDAALPPDAAEVTAYADAMGLDAQEREHWICFYQFLMNGMAGYLRADLPYGHDLVNFARSWKPDLVLWDPMLPVGAIAARASGAAHARLMGSCLDWPGFFVEKFARSRDALRAAGLSENPFAELFRPLADRYGLWVDDELTLGQWTVDPLPEGVRLPTHQPKVPVRWVPYAYPEPQQPWLIERPERPRISLSLGESMRRFVNGDWGRTPKLLEALGGLEVEVVATLNKRQLEGVDRIPDNVRIVDWLPLTQLLPTCSLHIHHGGNGTAMTAVANRVPHIVTDTDESIMLRPPSTTGGNSLTMGVEHDVIGEGSDGGETWEHPAKHMMGPSWARHVVNTGAGIRMNYQTASVEEIRADIARVLQDPSFRAGARAVHANWLGTPGPVDIVPILERLTAELRPGRAA